MGSARNLFLCLSICTVAWAVKLESRQATSIATFMDGIMNDHGIVDKIPALMEAQIGKETTEEYFRTLGPDGKKFPDRIGRDPPTSLPKVDPAKVTQFYNHVQHVYRNNSISDGGAALLQVAKNYPIIKESSRGSWPNAVPWSETYPVPAWPGGKSEVFSCAGDQGAIIPLVFLSAFAINSSVKSCSEGAAQCTSTIAEASRTMLGALRLAFKADSDCRVHIKSSSLCKGAKAEFLSYLFGIAHAISSSTFMCRSTYERSKDKFWILDQCQADVLKSSLLSVYTVFQVVSAGLNYRKQEDDQLLHSTLSRSLDVGAGIAWVTQLGIQASGGCSKNHWTRACVVKSIEIGTWVGMATSAADRYRDYCKDTYQKNQARSVAKEINQVNLEFDEPRTVRV